MHYASGMARRDEWAKRVEQWTKSGLSGAEFAARMGIREATLRHWKWALGRHERKPGWEAAAARRRREQRPAFVELVAPKVAQTGSSSPIVELVLPNGWQVRLQQHFDANLLRLVLDVIGSR